MCQGLDTLLTLCQAPDMLKKLIEIQTRNGWADAEMARRLGIGRSTWTDVRNGRLTFSDRNQISAARAFPELLDDLVTSVTVTPPEVATS